MAEQEEFIVPVNSQTTLANLYFQASRPLGRAQAMPYFSRLPLHSSGISHEMTVRNAHTHTLRLGALCELVGLYVEPVPCNWLALPIQEMKGILKLWHLLLTLSPKSDTGHSSGAQGPLVTLPSRKVPSFPASFRR